MQNNIHYYKASSADIDTLVENRLKFAIELNGEQNDAAKKHLTDQMRDYFERTIPTEGSVSFIAKVNGQTAGIGTVVFRETLGGFRNPSGKWGYIMNMYTVPEYRRQGICGKILDLLVEEGRRMGVIAFELHATEAGQLVYLKGGFQLHNEPTLRKFFH